MPKVRRRKSTNIYFDFNSTQAIRASKRRFTLTVANATGGSLKINVNGNGVALESSAIPFDASRENVFEALNSGVGNKSLMTDIKTAGGGNFDGPLGTQPVRFSGVLRDGVTVTVDQADLTGVGATATIAEDNIDAEPGWIWDNEDVWRDIGTARALMRVHAETMEFTVRPNGRWRLSYAVQNFTRRHKWVYKLDVMDANDQHLFTLVPPPVVCSPNDRIHEVSLTGRSQQVRAYFSEIARVFRRGAGQYRV